jgi:hypothetical protein
MICENPLLKSFLALLASSSGLGIALRYIGCRFHGLYLQPLVTLLWFKYLAFHPGTLINNHGWIAIGLKSMRLASVGLLGIPGDLVIAASKTGDALFFSFGFSHLEFLHL